MCIRDRFIEIRDKENNQSTEWETWIGNPFPKGLKNYLKMPTLQSVDLIVTASGHELERVKEDFVGIPIRRYARMNYWRGETAEFILRNWFRIPGDPRT